MREDTWLTGEDTGDESCEVELTQLSPLPVAHPVDDEEEDQQNSSSHADRL